MIAQINTGNSFGGLVNYANDIIKKDTVIVASEGVSLSSNAAIAASFKLQAKSHQTVKNFVGHISLSFSPEDREKVNDQIMAKIAKEYMRRMGIVNTQFVVFRHKDQPHPHIHIVYNRVDNDGNAIKGDTSYKKSAAITKALTREYGLTFGKGKKDVRRERLKGKDAIKYRLYDNITEAMKDSISWQQLRKALKVRGISLEFCRDNNGSVCGVTFTDIEHNVTFAGGKLDRSLTFGNIDRQMYNIYEITDDPNDQAGFYPHYDSEYITHVTEKYCQDTQSSEIEEAFDFTPKTGQESGSSSGSNIGAVMAEMLLQPHVVPTSGGGGSSSKNDDDDDKEKDKNKRNNFTPRKRKR